MKFELLLEKPPLRESRPHKRITLRDMVTRDGDLLKARESEKARKDSFSGLSSI